nr:hypothetical protein B0A51_01919 [Rachicladosporium sp. CCFEE 5018]
MLNKLFSVLSMACPIVKILMLLVTLAQDSICQSFILQKSYTGLEFFTTDFTPYTGYDPTFGFVHYVDILTAEKHGLLSIANVTSTGIARWGVDTQAILDPSANLGRMSLRLQSTRTYKYGLFVLDAAHVPANVCGTWPAFWMVGDGIWPSTGEIDIIETTNSVPGNLMSLHTTASPGCTVAGSNQTGTLLTNDCAFANSYTGCAVSDTKAHAAGADLNSVGGGVYAMLRTAEGIQMWSWPRNSVPEFIAGGKNTSLAPDLREFGTPTANFQGTCDFDAHFGEQQLIFNIDFCGSNAGQTFAIDGCPMSEDNPSWKSCNIYVANNPQAFVDSYWEINSLNVWTMTGFGSPIALPSESLLPMASTSSLSSLSDAANGRSSTPLSPIAAPTATDVQARDLTSFAGATWPASWTVPGPAPPIASHSSISSPKIVRGMPHAVDSTIGDVTSLYPTPSSINPSAVRTTYRYTPQPYPHTNTIAHILNRSPAGIETPPPDVARRQSSENGLMGPRDVATPPPDVARKEHTDRNLNGPRDIVTADPGAGHKERSDGGLMGPRDVATSTPKHQPAPLPARDAVMHDPTHFTTRHTRTYRPMLMMARDAEPEFASQLSICAALDIACYTSSVVPAHHNNAESVLAMKSTSTTTVTTITTTVTPGDGPTSITSVSPRITGYGHGPVTFEATFNGIVYATSQIAASAGSDGAKDSGAAGANKVQLLVIVTVVVAVFCLV